MVADDRFKLLTLPTGSPSVGWRMKERAGKKKVVLELGGNAGVIVDKTADLDWAVQTLPDPGLLEACDRPRSSKGGAHESFRWVATCVVSAVLSDHQRGQIVGRGSGGSEPERLGRGSEPIRDTREVVPSSDFW